MYGDVGTVSKHQARNSGTRREEVSAPRPTCMFLFWKFPKSVSVGWLDDGRRDGLGKLMLHNIMPARV